MRAVANHDILVRALIKPQGTVRPVELRPEICTQNRQSLGGSDACRPQKAASYSTGVAYTRAEPQVAFGTICLGGSTYGYGKHDP
jgi:hypothetical protein